MNILVIVASEEELAGLRKLVAKAAFSPDYQFMFYNAYGDLSGKPTMKALRELKPDLDGVIQRHHFDYVIAAGETAARLALDTSSVNINKLRGRDFDYEFGTKKASKKDKA